MYKIWLNGRCVAQDTNLNFMERVFAKIVLHLTKNRLDDQVVLGTDTKMLDGFTRG